MDQNYTHKYDGNAVSCCFTSVPEIFGFAESPKIEVLISIFLITSRVLNQIKREWSFFVDNKPLLLVVFSWFLKSA